MNQLNKEDQLAVKRMLEAAIKISALALMLTWCFEILRPFIAVIVWGALIAIIAKPINDKLEGLVKGRSRAATLLTLILLAAFISPTVVLVDQASEKTQTLVTKLEEGTLHIPAPEESVKEWPVIGEKAHAFWSEASSDIDQTLVKHKEKINELVGDFLGKAAGAGATVLMLIFAIIIGGVFLAGADGSTAFANKFIKRLAGDRGDHFASLASSTVRNVARGIIGVAIMQAGLAWLGFYLIDFPGAPLFALLVLLLSIVQINPLVLMVPTAMYVFSYEDSTLIATLYLVWSIAVGLFDNILKPIIMGKGADVPMMVIFLGAVGGFISYGFVGLFVGAVIVVLGYELFVAWLNEQDSEPTSTPKES
jgi:predicted PurR-regulated permease PerM